jgi:rubrerythrin
MDKLDYGRMAKCQEYNEQLIAKLYFRAADKIDDPIIKGAFTFIALDSQKHATIFREIAEEYDVSEFNPDECSMFSGMAYGLRGLLLEANEKLDKAKDISDILEVMEHIESVEATLAGGDRVAILDGMKDEEKRKLYTRLLYYIEEDEVRHERIIEDIIRKFKQK